MKSGTTGKIIVLLGIMLFSLAVQGAQVTIEEFGGYQDPFSQRFYSQTLPLIENEYGTQVELKFRHFPLSFHPDAQKAAEASECARDQGAFGEYHNILFENTNFDRASLKNYAYTTGLDVNAFVYCLDTGKTEDRVKNDFNEGTNRGVTGTPTFFIEGEKNCRRTAF